MNINFETEAIEFMRENNLCLTALTRGLVSRAMQRGAELMAAEANQMCRAILDPLRKAHGENVLEDSGETKMIDGLKKEE